MESPAFRRGEEVNVWTTSDDDPVLAAVRATRRPANQQAAGALRAVRAAGRAVPGDVAVTGWDDAAVAARLGLTTVAQSLRDQGASCALAALGQPASSQAASWTIVRRSSTRP